MSLRSINFKKDVVSYLSVRRPSSVNCITKMVTGKLAKGCGQKGATVYVLAARVDVSEMNNSLRADSLS